MEKYQDLTKASEWFSKNRNEQNLKWFYQQIRSKLEVDFFGRSDVKSSIQEIEKKIIDQEVSVRKAVNQLFSE